MTSQLALSRRRIVGLLAAAGLVLATLPLLPRGEAQSRAGGRSYARGSVHQSNVNVNANRNVNVHNDVNVNVNNGRYDRWGHPIAGAVAATATAVAIGSVVASLPPKCSTRMVGAVTYHDCGGVYYQPTYQGTSVQYVVVAQP